jgi:menaquinone-dependent protoporphyrinogen IX oxidase
MPTKYLVAFATHCGSTQEAAESIAATLREFVVDVDLQLLRNAR